MRMFLTPLALSLALLFLAGPALAQTAPAPTPSGPAYEAFQKAHDEYRAVLANGASTDADKAAAKAKFEAARSAWRTEQRASGNCTPGSSQGLKQGRGARDGSGPKANAGSGAGGNGDCTRLRKQECVRDGSGPRGGGGGKRGGR